MSATFVQHIVPELEEKHEIPSKCFECVGTGNKKSTYNYEVSRKSKKKWKKCVLIEKLEYLPVKIRH